MNSTPVWGRCLLLTALATLGGVHRTEAQGIAHAPWSAEIEMPLESMFTRPLVDDIAEWFELTEDQAALLDTFHEKHQEEFAAFRGKWRLVLLEFEEEMNEHPPSSLKRHLIQLKREEELSKVADTQAAMDEQFLMSIRDILSDEQMERWDHFDMWLTRQRWMKAPVSYPEQSMDLIALLEQLDERFPDERIQVPQDILDAYARQLDQVLHARTEFVIKRARRFVRLNEDRYRTDGTRVWIGPMDDPKKYERERQKDLTLRQRPRDINRMYADIFASQLPAHQAIAWRRHYRDTVLSRIPRVNSSLSAQTNDLTGSILANQDRPLEIVDQIREHVDDLDEEQDAQLDAILTQHDISLATSLTHLTDSHAEMVDAYFSYPNRQVRAKTEEEFRETLASYIKIERRTIDAILGVLTSEQRAVIEALDNSATDGVSGN